MLQEWFEQFRSGFWDYLGTQGVVSGIIVVSYSGFCVFLASLHCSMFL